MQAYILTHSVAAALPWLLIFQRYYRGNLSRAGEAVLDYNAAANEQRRNHILGKLIALLPEGHVPQTSPDRAAFGLR